MDESTKVIYRLYAMPTNNETAALAQENRFCRVTAAYVLIYTADEIETGKAVEISEDEVDRLASADRDWLLGCNLTLIAEDAKAREKEISAALSEKIEQLEKALEEVRAQAAGFAK